MRSIRWRLTVGMGLVCGAIWTGGGAALFLVLRAGLLAEFDQALSASVQSLATLTEDSAGEIMFDSAGEFLPAYERADRPDYFQIFLPGGGTVARSPSLGTADLPLSGGTGSSPEYWNLTLPDGERGRATGVRFAPKEDEDVSPGRSATEPRSEVTLVVARHRADFDHRLFQLLTTLLIVGVTTGAATSLVGVLLVRRGLHPLSRLAERAATIDATSLQLRFPDDRMSAELAPIVERLNDLLSRLESSFERERRFRADVAHELRTPIAELRALAEVSLKWPDEMEATRSALQDALAIALQMESIVTGLLALSRCEDGLLTVRPEAVPMALLIDEIWQPLAGQARRKNLDVHLSVPEDVSWLTDPIAVRAILTNLFSNAIEYSPVSGAVRVQVGMNNGRGRLVVSNTTDNLDHDDLPHLFERFWRKDPARASSAHSGLGLALTKAYADSLGLRLRAGLAIPTELAIELSDAACATSID